jgi:homoserine O-acetyltransferase
MDALVPMACQPTEMSGRNWMLRRLLVETIRSDPGWQGGDYTTEPRSLALAATYFGIATSGGSLALYQAAPTREQADKLVDARLAAPFAADANDTIYQWSSSDDYNPAPELERIEAQVLAINSADDERNPPELKIMEREMPRVRNGRFYLIPASSETRGHGTTGLAKFITQPLQQLLQSAPHRAM